MVIICIGGVPRFRFDEALLLKGHDEGRPLSIPCERIGAEVGDDPLEGDEAILIIQPALHIGPSEVKNGP